MTLQQVVDAHAMCIGASARWQDELDHQIGAKDYMKFCYYMGRGLSPRS